MTHGWIVHHIVYTVLLFWGARVGVRHVVPAIPSATGTVEPALR